MLPLSGGERLEGELLHAFLKIRRCSAIVSLCGAMAPSNAGDSGVGNGVENGVESSVECLQVLKERLT